MKKILIIPDRNDFENTFALQKEYNLGFEYNDFFIPDVLDDEQLQADIVKKYKSHNLPDYTTMHGAFIDVIPFSSDNKIKEVSLFRINQSISIARKIGAKAVVFHTNYNPFLNTKEYIKGFVKQNVSFWQEILNDNKDINIYIENMFDCDPFVIKQIAEELKNNDNFGVCLDWAHASISKIKPSEWAEVLGEYIKHIHINDNDLISDLHSAWGSGKVDRVSFYECYEKYFNNAAILIETNSFENKKKSLEQLKKDKFI